MDDKRTAIECLAIRQALVWTNTEVRWVHSAANPSNGMTKDDASEQDLLMRLLIRGQWLLVHDPSFESTRKRRAAGVGNFDEDDYKDESA